MRFSTAAYALFALAAGASAAVLPRVGDGMCNVHHSLRSFKLTWTPKGTFFAPGLGACGKSNGPNDLIVAVPESIFNSFGFTSPGNPNTAKVCGKTITAQREARSSFSRQGDPMKSSSASLTHEYSS
jgi:hypothetical protein